jgi:hypothetical protein
MLQKQIYIATITAKRDLQANIIPRNQSDLAVNMAVMNEWTTKQRMEEGVGEYI